MRNRSNSLLLALAAFLCAQTINAQTAFPVKEGEIPKGWHTMDIEKDGQWGISLDRTYEFLRSRKLKSKPVLVAVIDSGIDTLHEDLRGILWVNPKEIPNNGIDDDHNGYIDDINGWNFLGNKEET
jgi:subtilisin family serine protease